MTDLVSTIMKDIQDDGLINATDVVMDITSKGFFQRRKFLRIHGSVKTEMEKKKVIQMAEHHSGDNYSILDELTVKA